MTDKITIFKPLLETMDYLFYFLLSLHMILSLGFMVNYYYYGVNNYFFYIIILMFLCFINIYMVGKYTIKLRLLLCNEYAKKKHGVD